MLVLTRRPGQSVVIEIDGKECKVYLVTISKDRVRLGFEATSDFQFRRSELTKHGATTGGVVEPQGKVLPPVDSPLQGASDETFFCAGVGLRTDIDRYSDAIASWPIEEPDYPRAGE